ncbi:hypothetical protein [Agrococcus sp. SCSIO52902]|uniref:hypothetical protein n=1 Tax=Agrococcus sp. SCSIO52902 TaxID=2933290 RepID=UPI001FF55933|nr:hypothetical protein [Agrococcus sp. SCSIO52902]UOW00729.1 hypothetical protein MU522_12600 [Agrococcus sp. SCSIO52902]
MSLVLSLVLLGLAIGQRTVWAPPDTIVSQLEESPDSQLLLISGETMNAHDGRQTVTITADGPINAVVGRDHDVLGWVGDAAHSVASIDDTQTMALEEQAGNEEPLPELAGGDLWIEEHLGEGEVRIPIDLPVGYSLLIAGEPGQAAPADVRVEWPFDAKTPLFGPLLTAGLVLLALALLLFLLALRRHRRSRGPQRRSHRELSRAERRALRREAREGLPRPQGAVAAGEARPALEPADAEGSDASPVDASDGTSVDGTDGSAPASTDEGIASAPDGAEQDRGRGRAERAAAPRRRRLGLVALPVIAVVGLTGCGPQYWPSAEPAATSDAAPQPTSLEETLPPVALTESQFTRVLESTREAVAEADEALDIERAADRLAGPALDARRTNYEVRSQNGELPALQGIPDGDVELLLPQQTEVWPRTVMAVVGWEDGAQAQSTLVFQQTDARADYRLVYQMTLASGVQLPAVASPTIGAASLPGDTPLLLHRPDEITSGYASVLLRGDESEYASWFQEEGDALREAVGRAAKDELVQRPEFELSLLEWGASDDEQAPLMLVTNEGGALLATSFTETQRATPREEGVEIEARDGAGILAGVEQSDTGIETTYQIQVLFAVPPAGAPEGTQIQVVGYSQSLLDAREVG